MDAPRWIDTVTTILIEPAIVERFREAVAHAETDAPGLAAVAAELLKAIDGNAEKVLAEADRVIRDVARWTREIEMWKEAERRGPQ